MLRKVASIHLADLGDIARAYTYLFIAGWRLFVRHQRLDSWLARVPEESRPTTEAERQKIDRAARWTNVAARYPFPWARCLQRSLALCLWLNARGLRPVLRIGVRKNGATLEAHAWVEHGGQILNDGPIAEREFVKLPELQQSQASLTGRE